MPAKYSRSKQKKTAGELRSAAAISGGVLSWARVCSAAKDDLAVEDHAARSLLAKLCSQPRESARQLESPPRSQPYAVLVDEGEHAVAIEFRLPHPVDMIERRIADFGEHRCKLAGHRLDVAGRHELRGGHALHGPDLEIADFHAGKDGPALRSDVDGRSKPVLVLEQEPAVFFLLAHQGERAFHFLAAQQEAELAFLEAFPHLPLGLPAVMEPGFVFVG
jgi:hypothetical protein